MAEKRSLVLIVILLRVASGVYIFFNPLWGFILYSLFDWLDWYLLHVRGNMPLLEYQTLDKKLDWPGYVSMLLLGIRQYRYTIFLSLFLFKLLGQLLYSAHKRQQVFVLFPNLLEAGFIWYVLLGRQSAQNGLWFIFVLEIVKEVWLHILWPLYLKRNGYPKLLGIIGIRGRVNW